MKPLLLTLYKYSNKILGLYGFRLNRVWPRTLNPNAFSLDTIRDCQLVPTRKDLLEKMPKNGSALELGVASGDFSEEILRRLEPETLTLVDGWHQPGYLLDKKNIVEDRFEEEIRQGKIIIHQRLSTEAVDLFPDNHFDFVYIDTDHTYETTKTELELYATKVKPGAFLCGDDYTVGNVGSSLHYGVIAAVSEFCQENRWTLAMLSMEPYRPSSFALKKPSEGSE